MPNAFAQPSAPVLQVEGGVATITLNRPAQRNKLENGDLQVLLAHMAQIEADPAVRVLVLKSRGHFRAAFDEFFSNEQIIEVDVPGLTTPVLGNVAWERMPRPIYPLDPQMNWQPG